MSTTTLTRNEQVLTKPVPRATFLARTDSPRPPRQARGGRWLGARSARSTVRGIDVHARSVAMWPRTYR